MPRASSSKPGGHDRTAVDLAPNERAAVRGLWVAAAAVFAEMRGDLAFDMLMSAHERALADGDAGAAAITLADAATVGGRAPGPSATRPSRRAGRTGRAGPALAPADDVDADTHVTIAAAWNGRPGITEPDPALADRALRLARRLDDPVLISNALDAVAAGEMAAGHYKSAHRFTAERLDRTRRGGSSASAPAWNGPARCTSSRSAGPRRSPNSPFWAAPHPPGGGRRAVPGASPREVVRG